MSYLSRPEELLHHVRSTYSSNFLGAVPAAQADQIYLDITRSQLSKSGAVLPPPQDAYDEVLSHWMTELEVALPPETRVSLRTKVAVGALDHATVNAQILKGSEDAYAIVVNNGLMLLLGRFLKLNAAAFEPSAVIYCSRGSPSDFCDRDYLQMSEEVFDHYIETGVPLGPRLKLSSETEAAVWVAMNIRWVEPFILAHEVGHFVNGDLDEATNLVPWNLDNSVSVYRNEKLHACEFAADHFAMERVLQIEASTNPRTPALMMLVGPLTMTFNFLRRIADRESYSHPRASVRLVTLVRSFFGSIAANIMQRSFDDASVLSELMPMLGEVDVSEILSQRASGDRSQQ